MSDTIADEMIDDYIDGVTTGQLCPGCGREFEWCECDDDKMVAEYFEAETDGRM